MEHEGLALYSQQPTTGYYCEPNKPILNLPHSLSDLSPSWEAANCAATQDLPSILRDPKVHYRVHKSLPLASLSWSRSIQFIPSRLTKRHWGRFPPSTSVSLANHSTNFSIIIITRGWHKRPLVAAVPSGPNWTPPPTIPIKKIIPFRKWVLFSSVFALPCVGRGFVVG
jgi:hypothetical protein